MALGIYFAPAAMSSDQYDACIAALTKAGARHPAGRSYHVAFGPSDKLMVFDIWSSQASFERFGKTLMPILQQLGVDPGQPMISPVHKVLTKPAAKPKAKKKPAKKAGKKMGKKKR